MHSAGIRPNVRTYTALVAALGRGGQWERARRLLGDMRRGCPWGGAEPNAYTYSALLKCMGDQVRIGALRTIPIRSSKAAHIWFLRGGVPGAAVATHGEEATAAAHVLWTICSTPRGC